MDKIKKLFRRMALPDAPAASGSLVIQARHGRVTVTFASGVARFSLHVPLPTRPGATAYRGGAGSVLTARRPLNIRLRSQTEEDRQHLSSGIAAEISTGDAEFDEDVYIDTECEEASVKTVLNDEARIAVLELFRRSNSAVALQSVTIDDSPGLVVSQWIVRSRGVADVTAEHVEAMVAAMDSLGAAMPTVVSSGPRPAGRILERAVRAANYASLIGIVITAFTVCGTSRATVLDADYLVPGVVAGTCASAILIVLCYRFIRGHANSPEIRARAMVASIWLSFELGLIIAKLVH